MIRVGDIVRNKDAAVGTTWEIGMVKAIRDGKALIAHGIGHWNIYGLGDMVPLDRLERISEGEMREIMKNIRLTRMFWEMMNRLKEVEQHLKSAASDVEEIWEHLDEFPPGSDERRQLVNTALSTASVACQFTAEQLARFAEEMERRMRLIEEVRR
ncbi:hypothetical protein DRP77_09970 [Candidatus Poribacteria bacterium]|nr:MAG: hypothetical protein DRP77_09970 [Candidatus Poribacteria bacterium]